MNERSWKDKVALVTGGGSGIGRAACLAFARVGATVMVSDVESAHGLETVRLVEQAGGRALFVPADVSVASEVEAMVAATLAAFGRLDCAFNNAGIAGARSTVADYEDAAWEHVIAVNLFGVRLCMKHELKQMLIQGSGAIVNNASILGTVGFAAASAYVAAKHGVVGLTRQMAVVYSSRGVTINAVCPGPIVTNLRRHSQEILGPDIPDMSGRGIAVSEEQVRAVVPAGRRGTVEDIASAVCYLASDEAGYITGHSMVVDGGWRAK